MKPSLLLIPGLLCDQALWQHQIKALGAKANVQVADTTGADSIPAIAESVLAKAPATFTLAGLSMGGYVAMEIMRVAPNRVTSLALLDTTARPDTDEQKRRRKGLIQLSNRGDFKGVTPRLLPLLLAPDHLNNEVLVKVVMDMAQRVGQQAFVRQQTAILNRVDSRPDLANYKVPVKIVCGEHDALTPPEHAEEMKKLIGKNATLHIISGAGHLTSLEAPEKVTEILESCL